MVYADFVFSSSARAFPAAGVSSASGSWSPPLQRLFDTEAVPLHVWPWLFAGGFVFFVVWCARR